MGGSIRRRKAEFTRLAKHNRRWSYAILGLGLHKGMLSRTSSIRYSNHRHSFCCTVRPLFFEPDPNPTDTRRGLYSITFGHHQPDDRLAQRLADAVFAGLAIQGHPLYDEPPTALRFPSRFAGLQRTCSPDTLVAWYAVSSGSAGMDVMRTWQRIGTTSWVSPDIVAEVWHVLPALLSHGLFEASQFLCASLIDFSFPGDVATEYLAVPGRKPLSFFEQVRVEGAVLNAFKAIEAVIGDPPRDRDKLCRKLLSIGADPHENVGYDDECLRSLVEAVEQLRLYRDKGAAHGSTPWPRQTTFRQLNEFQTVAAGILWHAIDRKVAAQALVR